MRYPQLLICESDGRLARLLEQPAESRHWSLRQPRRPEACLRLLRRGGPSVLLLKLGHDPIPELTLLERVAWLYPETRTIVVGDTEQAALTDLAWDLGAAYVLFPPLPQEWLVDLITGLLVQPDGQPQPQHDDRTSPAG